MKKVIAILAALALITALTACGSDTPHPHTQFGSWQGDASNHWKLCEECGEQVETGKHAMNDDFRCSVCNSDVYEWDESVSVCTYDEYENFIRMADYDLDGNLISEMSYENEYDANGCIVFTKEYTDGRLTGESEYTVVDGESRTVRNTYYSEDGTSFINEYDDNGNCVLLIDYDADGNETLKVESQYAEGSSGDWYEATATEYYADGTVSELAYDEQGSTISRLCYDADGNVTANEGWEYTYDQETGFTATEKAFVDGVLVEETIYKIVVEEDGAMGYPETVTTYNADGTTTVTQYDADGNVIG